MCARVVLGVARVCARQCCDHAVRLTPCGLGAQRAAHTARVRERAAHAVVAAAACAAEKRQRAAAAVSTSLVRTASQLR
jgi:hypothetical protein